MNDLKARLVKAFSVVFPDLTEEQILRASQASVAGWDSTAAIMLVNVIEEEFGIEIDFDAVADLVSFELIEDYLQRTVDAAA